MGRWAAVGEQTSAGTEDQGMDEEHVLVDEVAGPQRLDQLSTAQDRENWTGCALRSATASAASP